MKILFDLTDLDDHLSGLERYALNLSTAMMDSFPNNEYILIFKNEVPRAYYDYVMREGVRTHVLRGCNKLLFRQLVLPLKLYTIQADVYLFLAFQEPLLFMRRNIITAAHDMTWRDVPSTMKWYSRIYFMFSYCHSFRYASRIITISRFSGHRIMKYASSVSEKYADSIRKKLRLVYCGVDSHDNADESTVSDIERMREKYGLPEEYILSLSTLEPRKNIEMLLQAYDGILKDNENNKNNTEVPVLVLAGRKGWKTDAVLEKYSEKLSGKLIITGFVDEEDMYLMYKSAKCFVFPSRYEGFGLPPAEAMAAGTPVLACHCASMPEILGDAAMYFEPGNIEDMKSKIIKLASLKTRERNKMIKAGIARAGLYNQKDEAARLYRIISKSV